MEFSTPFACEDEDMGPSDNKVLPNKERRKIQRLATTSVNLSKLNYLNKAMKLFPLPFEKGFGL